MNYSYGAQVTHLISAWRPGERQGGAGEVKGREREQKGKEKYWNHTIRGGFGTKYKMSE